MHKTPVEVFTILPSVSPSHLQASELKKTFSSLWSLLWVHRQHSLPQKFRSTSTWASNNALYGSLFLFSSFSHFYRCTFCLNFRKDSWVSILVQKFPFFFQYQIYYALQTSPFLLNNSGFHLSVYFISDVRTSGLLGLDLKMQALLRHIDNGVRITALFLPAAPWGKSFLKGSVCPDPAELFLRLGRSV